jgi:hypothetical protein
MNTSPVCSQLSADKSYSGEIYQESFEVSDDLPRRNSRSTWNAYSHYHRKVKIVTKPATWYTWQFVPSYPPCGHYAQIRDPRIGWLLSANWGSWSNPTIGLPLIYEVSKDGFIKAIPNENALRDKAFASLLPGIRPRLSLLNTLRELKDFKRLSSLMRQIGKLPKRNIPFRRILGLSNDAFLNYQFAIAPLVRDVEGFLDILQRVRSETAQLLQNEGTKRLARIAYDLHGTFRGLDESSSVALWPNQFGQLPQNSIGSCQIKRSVSYDVAVLKAQMEYSYTLSNWQRTNAEILAFLDALGVNNNPAIIWNAIPWSFVVDWFVDVSRWLDNFKTRNIEPVTVIHRWCWSVNIRRRILTYKRWNIGTPFDTGMMPVADYVEEGYKRSTSQKGLLATLSGSGMNPKEFILASSLAYTKMRR